MKKIGLVFLSLILTVVALVACKPTPKLSIEDRLVGEYTSDLGTWEFDKDGDVYFSGLKGWWMIEDESNDDESSENDSPQKISIFFQIMIKIKVGLVSNSLQKLKVMAKSLMRNYQNLILN